MITSNERSSSRNICHAAYSDFIHTLQELNLFSHHPFWSSTLKLSEQILSTRLYIFFLFISLLLMTIYVNLNIRTHTITREQFSMSDYERIQSLYPTTTYVPCTQIANPYSDLIHLNIKFHQICTSSFVDTSWISSLFIPNTTTTTRLHNVLDIHTFTFAQLQALALLCQTAHESIYDGHRTFNSTQLITTSLRSRDEFNEIVHVLIENFRSQIIANENRTARIVSMNIAYNRFMSALRTNFHAAYDPLIDIFIVHNDIYPRENSTCDCRLEGNRCTYPASISRFKIPGLKAGCMPLESIRQSTLECFYSQFCINKLLSSSYYSNISKPKALRLSQSKFSSNLTIGQMFDEYLFVESWQNTSNYEVYFNACAPRSLTYSYQGPTGLGSALLRCMDASGGVAIIWALLIPLIIKLCQFIQWNQSANFLNEIIQHTRQTILTLNLFPSDNENDVEEHSIGVITTRLYILFLFSGIIVLAFCTSLFKHTQMHTIVSPTINEFERLHALYKGSNLACTCTHHSLSFGRIVSISPRYHPICSSQFVEQTWLSYFDLQEIKENSTLFLTIDFRLNGLSFFNFTDALCRTAKETVDNAIHSFRYRRFVTIHTLSRTEFNNEVRIRLKRFQQQTKTSFINLIELIRSSIQTNNLVTDVSTNADIKVIKSNQTSKFISKLFYRKLNNRSCSCASSFQCTRPQGFYLQLDDRSNDPKIVIPGLVMGCYAIESLLLSTFQCFFEQKCLQLLIDSHDFNARGLLQPLHNSTKHIQILRQETTRFSPNTTIESIVSQLFIEDWNDAINFTAYYHRCAPKYCTYTVSKRFAWSYIIAMELGLYKTLSVILEISLPYVVRFIRRYWKRKQSNRKTINIRHICKSVRSWNLFSTQQQKHEEIFATRVYLIVFLLCIMIALLYAGGPLSKKLKTKKIFSPTSNQIDMLHRKNISTLSCKCSTTIIPYSKFVSINPQYHSICLNSRYIELNVHSRMIATLCQQAKRTIEGARNIFASRDLISIETMTKSSFHSQTQALIATFISQISADYRRTLTFIIRSFQVNHLLNTFESNWKIDLTNETEQHSYVLTTYPRRFSSSNCSCATSFDCIEQLDKDIAIGCFPFDGFRLSNFQNISLGRLNDKLFVETWRNRRNYTAYFQACQPLECQYTLPDRNNFKTMLLSLLELYGSEFIQLVLFNFKFLYSSGLTWVLYNTIQRILYAYQWCIKLRTFQ